MRTLNLQLFGNMKDDVNERSVLDTRNSVVDYLKSQGQDSSYSARKKLAKEYGISNYEGSAYQNIKLLDLLQNGNKSNAGGSSNKGGGSNKPVANNKPTTPAPSPAPAPKPANPAPTTTSEPAMSTINGVDQATYDKMNSSFATSDAYNQAMEYTNGLLQQISSGRTSYTDQIKDLMGQIQNRDPFEYDVDQDVLFQQMLGSAMASGKTAMQNTIGQASALTGGYGSTYATSVGNQQYNAYIQDAYANLPEYYQMALETYQMEGDEMYKQLAMLNEADMNEYQRTFNAWEANFNNAQTMYQNEYNSWATEVDNAFQMAGLQNSDYWSQTNFDEGVRQWEAEYAQAQSQFAQEMAYKNNALVQAQNQFDAEMAYKDKALKQEQENWQKEYDQSNSQFIIKNDLNGDGKVDSKDANYSNENNKKSAGKSANDTQIDRATELYVSGNQAEYNKYLNQLAMQGVDSDSLNQFIYEHNTVKEDAEKPLLGKFLDWITN